MSNYFRLFYISLLSLFATSSWSQPAKFPAAYCTKVDFKLNKNNSLLVEVLLPEFSQPKWLLYDNHANTMFRSDSVAPIYGNAYKIINLPIRSANGTKAKSSIHYLEGALKVGDLAIKNVTYMSARSLPDSLFGVLGRDVVRSGVWFFDFTTNKLTMASSIDSIKLPESCYEVEAKFNFVNDIIFYPFIEGRKVKLKFDFGFGGVVLLPSKEFNRFGFSDSDSAKIKIGSLSGSVPTLKTWTKDKQMLIGNKSYNVDVSSFSSYVLKVGLIGLGFFSKHQYLIIDYNKKQLFVGVK